MLLRSRYRGCLLGLACGDAVGTTVEFKAPGSFEPMTDMVGGGPFNLPVGAWTDDTSMALCLATSLAELRYFNPTDQMERYCRWFEEGYLSSTGECFDIGNATCAALKRYRQTGDPFAGSVDRWSSGNGCIMRLAPVPLFFFPERDEAIRNAGESARTTHAAAECIEGTRLFAAILCQALGEAPKDDILLGHGLLNIESPELRSIAEGGYLSKGTWQIRGSGYVVESLEAALWSFWKTNNFRDAILTAVNLGHDADTTAAVCGQIAGAFYGEEGIPVEWRDRLVMKDEIGCLAERLMRSAD